MISRDEELERNDGKWVAMNRAYTNKKKYNRRRDRKIDDPYSFLFYSNNSIASNINFFL